MSAAACVAAALSTRAEEVCRRYLPQGRKQGRYWTAGDVYGARGRSLFVRLAPPGTPGKFVDAATGQHGDLLDLIRIASGAGSLRAALDEARAFLAMTPIPAAEAPRRLRPRASGSPALAALPRHRRHPCGSLPRGARHSALPLRGAALSPSADPPRRRRRRAPAACAGRRRHRRRERSHRSGGTPWSGRTLRSGGAPQSRRRLRRVAHMVGILTNPPRRM